MAEWIDSIVEKQPALTEQDMQRRDVFLEKYFEDYDALNAALKMGYTKSYAEHMAKQFMYDSYVLNAIDQRKRDPIRRDEELKVYLTNALIQRAQYQGPGATETAKILALRTLGELHGLMGPSKPKAIKNEAPGGVMVVPQYADAEEWERVAIQSQKELTSNAT